MDMSGESPILDSSTTNYIDNHVVSLFCLIAQEGEERASILNLLVILYDSTVIYWYSP